ncbi:MAG: Holliday junction resolvase RuvX [Terriglobia bacterium]
MKPRILAIDFGTKRLGLAVSDPLGVVAQGLPTLVRTNQASDFAEIARRLDEYDVREVIVGRPLSKSGDENAMSRLASGFAEKLRERLRRPVTLWDERLTSAEANRLLRESGIGREKRRRAVDRVAAALILQSYLDWKATLQTPEDNAGDEA